MVNEADYEKGKAQRILAKTIPTNIARQQIEENTIDTNSSSTNLAINSQEVISVSTFLLYILQ